MAKHHRPRPENRARTGRKLPPESTRFKPGQSGNPGGRPTSAPITAAIREALDRDHDGVTVAMAIVQRQVRRALKGNLDAAKWLAERLEGKARQSLDVTHTPEPVDLSAMKLRSAEKLAAEFGMDIDEVLRDLEGGQ